MPRPTLADLPTPPAGKGGWPWMMSAASLPPTQPDGSPWPRISVVTPSYNQDQFIEETIRSVLLQGYPNLEYIVIDGGSADGSVETIKRYADHLHYWISEKDRGHGHALNKGFEQSSGEIMCWLNSDDMYLPWTFRTVAEIFQKFPQVNWIGGFNAWWSDHGALLSACRAPKNIYDYLIGNYAWIQQESVFWRRSLWERAGGKIDEKQRLMVDGALWADFFAHDQLYLVDSILAGYRVHSDNRANTYMAECRAEMNAIIASLRQRCPAEIDRKAQTLGRVKRFKYAPLLRYLPVERLARYFFKKTYASAGYPVISYEHGSWKCSELRFTV
jgi:glycosyltransferase involved in cell wall biosynthesis